MSRGTARPGVCPVPWFYITPGAIFISYPASVIFISHQCHFYFTPGIIINIHPASVIFISHQRHFYFTFGVAVISHWRHFYFTPGVIFISHLHYIYCTPNTNTNFISCPTSFSSHIGAFFFNFSHPASIIFSSYWSHFYSTSVSFIFHDQRHIFIFHPASLLFHIQHR